ncbi:hypothetical protein Q8F55_002821 [Vanrija albida]|uniref:SCP domain-containing protein n=1 Tax=Vanrija albida TaxID=181172 RepID=A0ABR3QAU8_9TREE
MFSTTALFGALTALAATANAAPVAPNSNYHTFVARASEPWFPAPPVGVNATTWEEPTPEDIAGTSDRAKWALQVHNIWRAQFDAPPMVWNATLAQIEADHTKACVWKHNPKSMDNLSGKWGGEPTVDGGISGWAFEYKDTKPEDLNHFTAMVWKSTTQLGCAWSNCVHANGGKWGGVPDFYFACAYDGEVPNMSGWQDRNVAKFNGKSKEEILADPAIRDVFPNPPRESSEVTSESASATASAPATATSAANAAAATPASNGNGTDVDSVNNQVKPVPADPSDPDYATLPECPDDETAPNNNNGTAPVVKPTPADPSDPDYSTLPECPDDVEEPVNGGTGGSNTGGNNNGGNGKDGATGTNGGGNGADGENGSTPGGPAKPVNPSGSPSGGSDSGSSNGASSVVPTADGQAKPTPANPSDPDYSTLPECPDDVEQPGSGGSGNKPTASPSSSGSGGSPSSASAASTPSAVPTADGQAKPTPADPSDPDYSTLPECPDDEGVSNNGTTPVSSAAPGSQSSVKPTPADPSDPDFSTYPECPDDIEQPSANSTATPSANYASVSASAVANATTSSEEILPTGNGYSDPNYNVSVQKNGTAAGNSTLPANGTEAGNSTLPGTGSLGAKPVEEGGVGNSTESETPVSSAQPSADGGSGSGSGESAYKGDGSDFWTWVQEQWKSFKAAHPGANPGNGYQGPGGKGDHGKPIAPSY